MFGKAFVNGNALFAERFGPSAKTLDLVVVGVVIISYSLRLKIQGVTVFSSVP